MRTVSRQKGARLAETLAKEIREQVLADLQPGDRLPPLRELARDFRVSVSTLQSVVAVLSQQGVVISRQGSGVYLTESDEVLRIGILSELDLLDPRISDQWRAVASLLQSCLEERGTRSHLYVGHAEPGPGKLDKPTCPQFWTDVDSGFLDAAILLDVPSTQAWYARVRACAIPMVGSHTGFSVHVDTEGFMRSAVEDLCEAGCRRLGLLSWHHAEAFEASVAACGGITSEAWIRQDLDPAVRGTGWEEFREIWSAAAGRLDGLVISDSMLFADAQLALLELGVRVPADLRIAVLTNRGCNPPVRVPVTAYETDPHEIAETYVSMLMDRVRVRVPQPSNPVASLARRTIVPSSRVEDMYGAPASPTARANGPTTEKGADAQDDCVKAGDVHEQRLEQRRK